MALVPSCSRSPMLLSGAGGINPQSSSKESSNASTASSVPDLTRILSAEAAGRMLVHPATSARQMMPAPMQLPPPFLLLAIAFYLHQVRVDRRTPYYARALGLPLVLHPLGYCV